MPVRAAVRVLLLSACLAPACGSLVVSVPALAQEGQKPLFRDGPCSGVLCGFIGGSQAPAAQAPQRSLFREGECGGVLCEAIGGSQAPRHSEPPPPCGGGLLCELAPYKMGVPVTAGEAARQQAEHARQEAALPAPAPKAERPPQRHRSRKARGPAVKSSNG